jgi:hypothetical protein
MKRVFTIEWPRGRFARLFIRKKLKELSDRGYTVEDATQVFRDARAMTEDVLDSLKLGDGKQKQHLHEAATLYDEEGFE